MATERTLSIIKPDAVAKNAIGDIIARFEKAGLKVVAAKMVHLSEEKAGGFYAEHKERPFFKDLVGFMTSGPVVVQVLEGEGAIAKNRDLMGATNPKEAAPALFALILRKQSTRTLSMVLILRKALSAKLTTSLATTKSARAKPVKVAPPYQLSLPAILRGPCPRPFL
ncbi:hypothetical protein HSBAA_09100 [Vreelandella sulfidaeris]|uniref:Nucleoside diphosphate kinase-like domain-containing protein n=1 Tax=Vreelandella sulfidaeris TaxID=115553 RepID=A0A455U7U5_9GAMM|nr:hypothetical protein HSBAA_09100 [Halomonas sulfidaeris]